MKNFILPDNSSALIFGSSGGIGKAIYDTIKSDISIKNVYGLSRNSEISFDFFSEQSIKNAAELISAKFLDIRLVIICTGFLYDEISRPEKSFKELDVNYLKKSFYLNAIGPGLIMKYFAPLLPRKEKVIFASLSAKVGSISDNNLGGWLSYRSSKAALNQLVKCYSIELNRKNKESICVSIHPGTVDTNLSKPFKKNGLNVRDPIEAAYDIINVLKEIDLSHNGKLIDYKGKEIAF